MPLLTGNQTHVKTNSIWFWRCDNNRLRWFCRSLFGRRLNGDYAIPAAFAAKALGETVKMVLRRADDARFDSVRSPSVQTLRMTFDTANKVNAMEHNAAAGWPTQVMAAFFMPKGTNGEPYDPFAISGADHWYDVGPQKVRSLSNDLANSTFRPGWLRWSGPDEPIGQLKVLSTKQPTTPKLIRLFYDLAC